MTVPTVFDLTKDIYAVDDGQRGKARIALMLRQGVTPPYVVDGLKMRRAPAQEGLHTFTPEELLSLYVQQIDVNGRVVGYQRDLDIRHARRVALALRAGKPMPVIHVALDGKGRMSIVDGQHRAAGAVIARLPIDGVIRRMNQAEQAELFFGQRSAKTVDPNVLVLAGTDPFSRYVQEALEDSRHAWSRIVSSNRKSKTRITPFAMFQLVLRYVANAETGGARVTSLHVERWDRGLADELALLISCFGNKQTHPLAFRPSTIQAIGAAARVVMRREERHPDDHERWQKHMPLFPFDQWLHIRTQRLMTEHLLDHWNKRLTGKRRVQK